MRAFLRFFGVALLAATTLSVFSQGEGGLAKKSRPAVSAPAGPLSVAELNASIDKVEIAVRRVVLANRQNPAARPAMEDRPATRQEVITEFKRLFEMARPHFKFTPRPVKFDATMISIPTGDPARAPLETMIRFGFIGKVAPIATALGPNLTLEEFGDALGLFLARIGDLTHTPSEKWSPYMFNHKDG